MYSKLFDKTTVLSKSRAYNIHTCNHFKFILDLFLSKFEAYPLLDRKSMYIHRYVRANNNKNVHKMKHTLSCNGTNPDAGSRLFLDRL